MVGRQASVVCHDQATDVSTIIGCRERDHDADLSRCARRRPRSHIR